MAFKEDLQNLSIQIEQRKEHVTNEETTKHSLIIPFIQVLGYDIFNPLEVKPEYTADFGKKKGEKVDYAIFKNGNPIIFLEAKSINDKLNNHDAQLSRYFNSTPNVKLAILSNGLRYKFFTDLNADNIMDETPFFEFNICDVNDDVINILHKFSSAHIDTDVMSSLAEELAYLSILDKSMKTLFQDPTDDFIRLIIKDLSTLRLTSTVVDRFRPLVKKAIKNALLSIVTEGILQPDLNTVNLQDNTTNETNSNIITTPEELESYELIKTILKNAGKDISEVNYKDTTGYFAIYYKNIRGWFLRLNLDSTPKYLVTRLEVDVIQHIYPTYTIEPSSKGMGLSRVLLETHQDILKLGRLVVRCFDELKNIESNNE